MAEAKTGCEDHNGPVTVGGVCVMSDQVVTGLAEVKWQDVTDLLEQSREVMGVGQMITAPNFSLHRAMTALELMDARMDPGLIANSVRSLDQRLEEKSLPLELSFADQVAIADELVAAEASFYEGESIAHTVFTCLYIQRPSLLQDTAPALYALLVGVMRCCLCVFSTVCSADLFVDEDFCPSLMGLKLDISSDREALKLMAAATASLKASGDAAQQVLASRLLLHTYLLKLHMNLAKPMCRGVKQACACATQLVKLLPTIRESLATNEEVGFERNFGHTLATCTPPRKSQRLSRAEGLQVLEQHVLFVMKFHSVLEESRLEDILARILALSAQDATAVARSQLMTMFGDLKEHFLGKASLPQRVQQSMQAFSSSVSLYADQEGFRTLAGRVSLAMQPYLRLLCLGCGNQHRQARKVLDWAVLAQEAQVADMKFMQQLHNLGFNMHDASTPRPCGGYPFFSWVLSMTLRIVLHRIQLGCRLELYSPREAVMVFWYLNFLLQQALLCEQKATKDIALQKKKGKRKTARLKAKDQRPSPRLLILQLHFALCQGTLKTLLWLQKREWLKVAPFRETSVSVVFQNRFGWLQQLAVPPLRSPDHFLQETDLEKLSPLSLKEQALNAFTSARAVLKQLQEAQKRPNAAAELDVVFGEVRDFLRVIVTNTVCLKSAHAPTDVAELSWLGCYLLLRVKNKNA